MRNNFRLHPDENVLIVCDIGTSGSIANIFYHAALAISKHVVFIEMEPAKENAQEPPPVVANFMRHSDVVLLITTYSLSHTRARKNASDAGARIASMPGITQEMAIRTLTMDYRETAELSRRLASILTQGAKAILQSANGTEASFDLSNRTAFADTGFIHNPGDFDNLPAGEAFIAPVEGKSEGIIVFDGCFADIRLDQPIKILIEKGQVVDIQGGEAARLLNEKLSRVDRLGYNIAELGIGTNKMARLDSGALLEVEKVFETVHVALGNNATIGGEVDVPFHSDGVILLPTLKVDSTYILKDGRFQL